MNVLIEALIPELVLVTVACVLLMMGAIPRPSARRATPVIALLGLLFAFGWQWVVTSSDVPADLLADENGIVRVYSFAHFIKLLTAGVGMLFVLLAWPSNRDATGNAAIDYATEAGEFFGLMLLSIAGVFLVADANDLILLFLGIELASIPTYIMVAVSRPIPAAQEAGVKYFFLGAMAAALMLFGMSYLYGTTGSINLYEIGNYFRTSSAGPLEPTSLGAWAMLGVLIMAAGFAFKLAAVPMHFYAGDVYQGAATPVTAFLSFVPKASGLVALIKLIHVAGGNAWTTPETLAKLLWVIAALTMTVGNVLGLLQFNVKRLFAYSSIAHSGYMLTALTALAYATTGGTQDRAMHGVLFYLTAYGIMNAGAFGVLMLIPARAAKSWGGRVAAVPPATTAETFEDLAGSGRRHPALGLAMAICCFSLIGLPLTVGFFGKLYLILPALDAQLYGLVVLLMINAAISAAYYLKIIATMFLRAEPDEADVAPAEPLPQPFPIRAAILASVAGTLVLGILWPTTQMLSNRVAPAVQLEPDRGIETRTSVQAMR